MKIEIIKEYIDIDMMREKVLNILKEARDDYKDGEFDNFLDDSDETLEERALWQAVKWNDNMRDYLHAKSHDIWVNFNDIDIDYPTMRNEHKKYRHDRSMVDDLTRRLDDNCQDEQTQADRKWLVDWFFDTFGTYNFKYNFQSEMSEALYELEHETA